MAPGVNWLAGEWPTDVVPARQPLLFVIAGASGAGKDTILAALRPHEPHLHFVVTTTTRPRRVDELPDVHYHFLTEAEFVRLRAEGGFLETAVVHRHLYGSPLAEVTAALARGDDVIVKPDVQGAASIKRRIPQAVLVYVAPGNVGELTARLRGRNSEDEVAFAARVAGMERELAEAVHFDYVVVNRMGQVDAAVADLRAIIQAERLRVRPRVCLLAQ